MKYLDLASVLLSSWQCHVYNPLAVKTSLVIWWFFTVFQSKDPVGYNEITLDWAYRSNINYHMFTHCLKSYLQRTFLIGHFMSYRSKSSNDPDKTSIKWTHTSKATLES
jgi:hypothetical protein